MKSFDPRAYGAIGDGVTLDTQALQSTIDVCRAAGGGRVFLASGTFLSGTLRCKVTVRDIEIMASGGGDKSRRELAIEMPGNGTRVLPV